MHKKEELQAFYSGPKGAQRLRNLHAAINRRVPPHKRGAQKTLFWTAITGFGEIETCPFNDNQRAPYGNGAFDRVIIIHCFDMTCEPKGLMAEAARLVRDHGIIEVIGWTKPVYDFTLPIWPRERWRVTLRFTDAWSLKWRRYEKVQDLLTLNFDSRGAKEAKAEAALRPTTRSAA